MTSGNPIQIKTRTTRPRYGRWPIIFASLTAVAGICISLYLRSRIAQTESTTAKLTAETLRLNTEQDLNLFADVLESVCALHALSDAVDQAAMDEFVQKGLVHQHAVLGSFGLTQRINPRLRAEIEGKEKNQPGAYQVVQSGPDGTWIPAGSKPAYYPLTWQSRANGLNVPIGFDFSSLGEEAQSTIEQIERTRRPALVLEPISRNQRSEVRDQKTEVRDQRSEDGSHNSQSPRTTDLRPPTSVSPLLPALTSDLRPPTSVFPSYWVFAPVIPQRFGNAIGFAVAVLYPETILQRVAALSGSSYNLRMTLQPLPLGSETKNTIQRTARGWLYRHPLEAIGTQWIFECSLPVTATGHRSTFALVIGLIITALMTSQLLLLGNRTRKIEAEVRARTEDLRIANSRLEENLHERARLEEEMNELAARERRQIGRDLHDSLGQKLTGAVFLSRALMDYFSNSLDRGTEDGGQRTEVRGQKTEDGERKTEIGNRQSTIGNQEAHARTLNETLKSAVAQVRNMARGLAPVTLNDENLCEALKQLAEEMTGLYGVSCEVKECSELLGLDRKTNEQLYLIAREAINNAARHAQAGHITTRLIGGESAWMLHVEDDGKGLPSEQPNGDGMGIRIMRHRSDLIGAKFIMSSIQGKGTRITVERKS